MLKIILASAAIGLAAAPAFAANLPNGTYVCMLGDANLGSIEIADSIYRGPAYDGHYEGDYAYEVTDQGTINWGGPLGGISSDGNQVASTVVTDIGGGRYGFDITIQNSGGNFQTISCQPE
jgi:hypothetical protein